MDPYDCLYGRLSQAANCALLGEDADGRIDGRSGVRIAMADLEAR